MGRNFAMTAVTQKTPFVPYATVPGLASLFGTPMQDSTKGADQLYQIIMRTCVGLL